MRVESTGQMSGQRVKTKSAIQTCPVRSPAVTVAPCRSVSEKAGTVPSTGQRLRARAAEQDDDRQDECAGDQRRPARRQCAAEVAGLDGRRDEARDPTEIGQEHQHQEDAEHRGRERDVLERALLVREMHVVERHHRGLARREQDEADADDDARDRQEGEPDLDRGEDGEPDEDLDVAPFLPDHVGVGCGVCGHAVPPERATAGTRT